jgi:recombination protein RecT
MPRENLKNKLAEKVEDRGSDKNKPKTISQWIEAMKPEIEKALPKVITVDRFARMALTAVRVNPKLAQCTPMSLMAALMQAAQLGLEPNTPLGQAYLIPYGDQAQFQIGYKGMIDLAHRSGQFRSIYAHAVHEKDDFDYQYGLNQDLKHKPAVKDRGEVVGYYAVYHLLNGGYGFIYMSREEVEKHAQKYSPAVKWGWESPWETEFDEMAKKTVLKKLLKYAPVSVEFTREIAQDETIKNEILEDMTEVPGENVFEAKYTVSYDEDKRQITNE